MTPAAFRAAREKLGLSQAQAARLLGYGAQSRISEIEGGKTDKVNETAARLMRAYLVLHKEAPHLLPDDWPR